MVFELPREEIEFFSDFGLKLGSKHSFAELLQKLDGIDVNEIKSVFEDLEKEFNKLEIDVNTIENVDSPEQYKKFIEEIIERIPTEKFETRITKFKKSVKPLLLKESLKNIMKENETILKETESRILKTYGKYPGELSFLWFYFITNVHNAMNSIIKEMDKNVPNNQRKALFERSVEGFNKASFDISYGFMRLSSTTNMLLNKSLTEENIVNLEREIFDIVHDLPVNISMSSIEKNNQNLASALIS